MTVPYTRAPHRGGPAPAGPDSLHAALLIDFDNVTMGMRSDLSKELKTLLASDVIKGKVSVQRAYADWRRYPQYIVPLSEASVDLIFAPAYGSNKKNATDIRMAIDALELVFIRPEIGTFILLTGDSDFSSLVLKLKEYGKYVIGVGIQESSSDILVQNCDEYYSYTSLTGLTKTTELTARGRDPWVLVKDAVAKMVSRDDVMRSDRLKQVMQEIDPNFDESAIGFSKFSKFLTEASSRGLVELTKVGNGQYDIAPGAGKGRAGEPRGARRGRGGRGRGGRGDAPASAPDRAESSGAPAASAPAPAQDPLEDAYGLLRTAVERLRSAGRHPARDSDVKRKMLEERPEFDEAELGFTKFSKFLAQAEEHGVVRTQRGEGGLDVLLADGAAPAAAVRGQEPEEEAESETWAEAPADERVSARHDEEPEWEDEPAPSSEPTVFDVQPDMDDDGPGLGPRRGSTRRRGADEPPPLFEGQVVSHEATQQRSSTAGGATALETVPAPSGQAPDLDGLGLPSDPEAIVRYLTHRYKGVGEKTAETLVETFGTGLFATLRDDPDAVARVVPAGRAEQVLDAWKADYERRTGSKGNSSGASNDRNGGRRGRGRGRSRGHGRD
ncbi:MAG TPA: NYN domain-containing protein [Longimicrobiales bacterium]|nr:NYN domain-containing protein [Longimicrobiales bacterium]